MHIQAIAVGLPTMGYWYTLHSHAYTTNRAVWKKEDREEIERIHQLIRDVYGDPSLAINDPKPDYRKFYNSAITVDEALSRAYPSLITAHRSNRSLKILEARRDRAMEVDLVATSDDDYGYQYIMLHKGARFCPTEFLSRKLGIFNGLNPETLVYAPLETDRNGITKPNMAKKMEISQPWIDGWMLVDQSNPEKYVDMMDVNVRSNLSFISFLRNHCNYEKEPLFHSGHYKIVMVPREQRVVIKRKKGGHEELQPAPRRWD